MTKNELAIQICKRTGVDMQTAVCVIEALMVTIKDSMAQGENVYLRGFGSFVIKKRAPKTARNISKNTTLLIPERLIPKFVPSDSFSGLLQD